MGTYQNTIRVAVITATSSGIGECGIASDNLSVSA